jgi:secretion/DNA translocation related CpaE-like protein
MGEPMLISADRALCDLVQTSAAATGVELRRVETDQVRLYWRNAGVVIVGVDLAPVVAGLNLARRADVYVVGTVAEDVLAWSAPLHAPGLVLPRQSGSLTALLEGTGGDTAGDGRVLAVVGGSGGLGASTLAAGLAVRAAKRSLSVTAVELDRCGGGLDVLFGAEQTDGWRWGDLVSAQGHLGDISDQLPKMCGVRLLSTGRESADSCEGRLPVGPAAVRAVLGSLRRSYDLVVLDSGQATPESGDTVFVVAAEVRAVLAARTVLEDRPDSDVNLVVRTGKGLRLSPDIVADSLGLPLVGVFHEDPRLPQSLEAGSPPARGSGKTARVLDSILDQLAIGQPEKRGSLLERIRG